MDVTEKFLSAGASAASGYTRRQIELLGLDWPPPRGWKNTIIGAVISEDAAAKFLRLADAGNRKRKVTQGAAGAFLVEAPGQPRS